MNQRTLVIRIGVVIGAVLMVLGLVYYGTSKKNGPSDRPADWASRDAIVAAMQTRMQTLAKQIPQFQGRGVCDVTEQCRIAGLGKRVCGNFKDYLIYSIKDADEARLLPFVTEFNDANKTVSDYSLAAETCGVKPARIACVQKRCVPEEVTKP